MSCSTRFSMVRRAGMLFAGVVCGVWSEGASFAGDCTVPPPATFTVSLPLLGFPPDEEGQGWDRPRVWEGHGASDDSIVIPNGRPIYALLVSGYRQNAYFDELIFYNFARHLLERGAYVHYAWWNNLLAPYMERPLHFSQSHPGLAADLTNFTTPAQAANKAVPGEDYQFVADAERLLEAIRANNPSAIIILAGHSMGGGAVVHLAARADVVIDIAAPIDPVGNRNYPWAGPVLYRNDYHYNWTRWRVTRSNFLGYRSRFLIPGACDPSGPWLANINEAVVDLVCVGGPHVHGASALRFGSHVINLHHRWQNEALFPFDYHESYSFNHTRPPGGTTSQSAVATRGAGDGDPGGWPAPNLGGTCCPIGVGVGWPGDGHGEIVGFRGPVPPEPLGVRVKTSPNCDGCPNLSWPARTRSVGGTWGNGDSASRRALLMGLEGMDADDPWAHEPYNSDLCLVSAGLIGKYNSMNKPPVAEAGPEQIVECDGCETGVVTLDGSGSTDTDGDALDFRWSWNGGSASGEVVDVSLPVGNHCVRLEVEDPSGHIARDVVSVTVVNPSAIVMPFTSAAGSWQAAAGAHEGRAFDEFFPGLSGDTGCLLASPFKPAVMELEGGTLTVSANQNGDTYCAISDSGTTPAVSDASLLDRDSVAVFEFDPPVEAFYTYFGSLGLGHQATMELFDTKGGLVESITSPPSTHVSHAAGLGFTSRVPIGRIELTTSERGPTLVGAFVGLRAGESSLGTVDLGDYDGPDGSGVIELDFACVFVRACRADFNEDDVVNSADVGAFLTAYFADLTNGTTNADFDGNGVTTSADVGAFLTEYFATIGPCV